MNDITKARHFLKLRGSKLQHLGTFALMLATAESKYREVKMRKQGNVDTPGSWDVQETEAVIDLALLKYLKKYNRLPKDAERAIREDTPLDEKRAIAARWASS